MPDKYAEIPEFGQIVEYITQADPVEQDGVMVYGVVINQVDLSDLDLTQDIVMDAVLEDMAKVANLTDRADTVMSVSVVKPIPDDVLSRINERLAERGDVAVLEKGADWNDLTAAIGNIGSVDVAPIEEAPIDITKGKLDVR